MNNRRRELSSYLIDEPSNLDLKSNYKGNLTKFSRVKSLILMQVHLILDVLAFQNFGKFTIHLGEMD